jgi:hypothetical protein
MDKVICTCGHLGVETGEVGIFIDSDEEVLVQWNNGIIEKVQYDFIEFLTARNKKAYIVSFDIFKRLFLNKKEAEQFKKRKLSLGNKVDFKILSI